MSIDIFIDIFTDSCFSMNLNHALTICIIESVSSIAVSETSQPYVNHNMVCWESVI